MATYAESPASTKVLGPFKNEPFLDFTKSDTVRQMRAAIEKVRSELGREYDLVIGGKLMKTAEKIKSLNPAKPTRGGGHTPESRRRTRGAGNAGRAEGV